MSLQDFGAVITPLPEKTGADDPGFGAYQNASQKYPQFTPPICRLADGPGRLKLRDYQEKLAVLRIKDAKKHRKTHNPVLPCWLVRSISMFRDRKSTAQNAGIPLFFNGFSLFGRAFFSVKSASVPFKCLECTLILLLKKARFSSLSYHSIALITTLIRIIIFTDTT